MKISVYITSYNQKSFLIEAIESVLAQTLPPNQIIIVDDYSTDGSQEVIAGYASRYDQLITAIYHTRNQGVTQTRIDALQAVTGDYVTYVDGDDRCLPAKLEKEAALLEANPDAQIAYSNYYYMTANGRHIGMWADGETPPEGDIFCQTFAGDFPRQDLFRMALVNYQAWKLIGFHDPNLFIFEDYDMLIRLTKQLQAVYCNEPLFEIRKHRMGLSSSDSRQHLIALYYIYRKNMPLLDELSEPDQKHVKGQFEKRLARYANRATAEALKKKQWRQAWQFYKMSFRYHSLGIWRIIARLMVSDEIYRRVAKARCVLRRKYR